MSRLVTSILLLCAILSGAPQSRADEIQVTRVTGKVGSDFYFVEASVHIELSADAEDALESGVPLQFSFDFQINRPRRFLWDQQLLALRRSCTLERHALANKYVVTDLVTRKRVVIASIRDALDALGQLTDVTIGKASELVNERGLTGRMRAQLDIEALPAPMRPIAYLSPSWHLKSAWREWVISNE
jgi:hypothetical protein